MFGSPLQSVLLFADEIVNPLRYRFIKDLIGRILVKIAEQKRTESKRL